MRAAPTYQQLPEQARSHLAKGRAELIYNPYATATWRLVRAGGDVLYLKAGPVGWYPSLAAERERCAWLAGRGLPVREVVDYGGDGRVEWLLMIALAGTASTAPQHLRDPARTVPILAEGLCAFHAVDRTGCPFDYRIANAIGHAATRVSSGAVDADGFHDIHHHLTPHQALSRLRELAPDRDDDVVVCHGDYCLPNVLLHDGRVVAYLDLGEVGLAERWRDLAVATWSVTWNLGPGYEDLFLDAYGADWDVERRDFYRLLYDLEA